LVAFTSKTPSPISRIETSNVPPPRSKTAIFSSFFLSSRRRATRRGLVDDAEHVQAGDLAGIFRGLALAVVEVGRHGDHRLGDGAAEVVLGRLLHLLEDEGRDLRRAVLLAAYLDPGVAVARRGRSCREDLHRLLHQRVVEATPDQALDGEDGVLRVGDRLALRDLPDQPLAALGEGDHRRGGPAPFCVGDDDGVSPLEDATQEFVVPRSIPMTFDMWSVSPSGLVKYALGPWQGSSSGGGALATVTIAGRSRRSCSR
jgi:hypothetical protein